MEHELTASIQDFSSPQKKLERTIRSEQCTERCLLFINLSLKFQFANYTENIT